MITLNLTEREASILYLKFDLLTNGGNRNKVLGAVFGKLEQSLLTQQNQDAVKKELRFNILTEFQISQSANLRK